MHSVTDKTFNNLVLKAKTPVIVDFGAEWCVPCKAMTPIIDKLAREFADQVAFTYVDVDQFDSLAATYGVMGLPTVICFENGRELWRTSNSNYQQLQGYIQQVVHGARKP